MNEPRRPIELMTVYRIASPTGEVFLHIPSVWYLDNDEKLDHRKIHFHQRFRSEVNTCISNITGFELSSYNRKDNVFVDNAGDDIIFHVGHVTMPEWNVLKSFYSEGGCDTVVEAALQVIRYRTGVDRHKQITTGNHGPEYWDDDSEEESYVEPNEKNFFIEKFKELLY